MLQTGTPAPMFVLPDASMHEVNMASCLARSGVILFFYPKDLTPSCVQEAAEFSDHLSAFSGCGFQVFGISRDDCLTHEEFADRHGIATPLLADVDGVVCRLYDVLQLRDVDGVGKECLVRSTFVIDRSGLIRVAQYGVSPRGHAMSILKLVRELVH